MNSSEQVLYVGSYADADQAGIYRFRLDEGDGTLTLTEALAGIASPSFLVVHPNGRWLYTVSETPRARGVPAVWAVQVAAGGGGLAPINEQPSGGDWPCHLALDGSGRWLVVSNYGSGSVGVLPIGVDGAVGALTALVQHTGSGPHAERQAGPHAHSALFTPDNRFVIVADLGMDALVVYRFDAAAGTLTGHSRAAARAGAGPRHMGWLPGRPILYVANELDSTVAVYDYDGAGGLQARQVAATLPPDAPENYVADLHVDAAGERVYVSNRGHDSLAIFRVGADGGLVREAVAACGGQWPRNFALAPGGGFLLAANQSSDGVAVLPLRPAGEGLGAPVTVVPVVKPSCVQFAAPAGG